ncbi:uncharacterized protein LOC121790687 [Salvia splendens]|uniref:uncharacterized protein LOC121790687 n=1 Tax=Salvia splendens TaxID=180675 RepID=UPI001C2675A1|nr:uncharacterized protein LOC121790687 [Salvia splendens]
MRVLRIYHLLLLAEESAGWDLAFSWTVYLALESDQPYQCNAANLLKKQINQLSILNAYISMYFCWSGLTAILQPQQLQNKVHFRLFFLHGAFGLGAVLFTLIPCGSTKWFLSSSRPRPWGRLRSHISRPYSCAQACQH